MGEMGLGPGKCRKVGQSFFSMLALDCEGQGLLLTYHVELHGGELGYPYSEATSGNHSLRGGQTQTHLLSTQASLRKSNKKASLAICS